MIHAAAGLAAESEVQPWSSWFTMVAMLRLMQLLASRTTLSARLVLTVIRRHSLRVCRIRLTCDVTLTKDCKAW